MEEDVKTMGQGSDPAESSTANGANQNIEADNVAHYQEEDSSTEDVKIPSEGEGAEQKGEGEGAMKPKASNRFQQLANEKNKYKSLWEKDREELARVKIQLANSTNLSADGQVKQALAELRLSTYETQETIKWEKAFAKHPELETDRELQDLVYSQYVARKDYETGLTPEKVAADVFSVLEKKAKEVRNKAYSEAEQNINKQIASQVAPSGKRPATNADDDWNSLLDKAARGDEAAKRALFAAI